MLLVLVHPTCGPTQQDDIPGKVRYLTYKKLEEEISNKKYKMGFLPYSMHMAGPERSASTYDYKKKLWMYSFYNR